MSNHPICRRCRLPNAWWGTTDPLPYTVCSCPIEKIELQPNDNTLKPTFEEFLQTVLGDLMKRVTHLELKVMELTTSQQQSVKGRTVLGD